MAVLYTVADTRVGMADTVADRAAAAAAEAPVAAAAGEEATVADLGCTESAVTETRRRKVPGRSHMELDQAFAVPVAGVHPSRLTWAVPVVRRLRSHLRRFRWKIPVSCTSPCWVLR